MEEIVSKMKVGVNERIYCVTGATGFIGSWLVKSLLQRGCTVHATLRNPEKASHFMKFWEERRRLRLFTADLHDDGSFDEAVRGCHGVFHVAASMEFTVPVPPQQNHDSYIQTQIIDPAIRGTLTVLKACLKSNTCKRFVFTSSISTLTAKDGTGNWKSVVDESCQTSRDNVLINKASGWVYVLSKLLTEEEAFKFAEANGIRLVSVITTTVGGPFLTPTVPASIQVLLSPLTGDPKMLQILESVNSRMGSISLVHIEDICSAHIFLMEHPDAVGRYVCCTGSCVLTQLVGLLRQEYPYSIALRLLPLIDSMEQDSELPCEISSKKIRDLGFEFKYSVDDIIHQAVRKCLDVGYLPTIGNVENREIL